MCFVFGQRYVCSVDMIYIYIFFFFKVGFFRFASDMDFNRWKSCWCFEVLSTSMVSLQTLGWGCLAKPLIQAKQPRGQGTKHPPDTNVGRRVCNVWSYPFLSLVFEWQCFFSHPTRIIRTEKLTSLQRYTHSGTHTITNISPYIYKYILRKYLHRWFHDSQAQWLSGWTVTFQWPI